jgi:hypothetical protein
LKKVLIIYPHYPPSNLAGVHRARLFAQHLPSYGWEPVILTVDEKYYEEKADLNLVKLIPVGQRIEKVGAMQRFGPVGDIGIRGWREMYKKAILLASQERIDFIFIPIPSFYSALLGRALHAKTGIPYGIDYIDPWVHEFPGSKKIFSKAWFSSRLARLLEPIAIKKAALITGVAEGYYTPVLERNKHLQKDVVTGAMPYGGESGDHLMVKKAQLQPYLFARNGKMQFVYAGALLPKSYEALEIIFERIQGNSALFSDVEFHFIGTGIPSGNVTKSVVEPLALKFGLWGSRIFEYRERIPYLDVLTHLENVDAVFILGSTEPHYTPSKTYQAVMSHKPVFAVLHEKSTGVEVIEESSAGVVLKMDATAPLESLRNNFIGSFERFRQFKSVFDPASIDNSRFFEFSAAHVTRKLADLLNEALKRQIKS